MCGLPVLQLHTLGQLSNGFHFKEERMRRIAAWMLALGLAISPAALAANGTDTGKTSSDTSKDDSKKDDKNGNKTTPTATPSNSEIAAEVEQLRAMLSEQSEQIAELRAALARRDGGAPSATSANAAGTPSVNSASASATVTNSLPADLSAANVPPPANPAPDPSAPPAARQNENPKESPLSFRIGGAEFTPGGWMDFTNIFRTTNEGTIGTNFFNIPFSNTVTGHLTEDRFTMQNSRVSLKVHGMYGKNDITAYYEMDFLGNDAANVEVTSNSHTFRSRLYFLDWKRDKFEVQAGQMWGWLTPNRVGVSPMPSDIFYSQNMDVNYQVGLTWTRQPAVRFIYHPNDHWAFGVGLENPEQFGGQGEITFPSAFNAQLAGQIDSAAGGTAVPNIMPDIVPKIAYDTTKGGKHYHVEAAGLLSGFKVTDLPDVSGSTFVGHTKVGAGVSAAVNLEVVKNLHVVANAFWSDGGGRYIFGMAPDLVVLPTNAPGKTCVITGSGPSATASGCDVFISPVHAGSGVAGFEYQVTPKSMLYGYYGIMYAQRNTAQDLTNTNPSQPFIGFGGPNSANSNNRTVQEPSAGWIQTFWKHPQYGSLQLITQGAYVTRDPWFVAAGAPKNAHLTMIWIDLRYVLP
jgi:hypothetical protein